MLDHVNEKRPAGARAASAGTFILYASHIAAMRKKLKLSQAVLASVLNTSVSTIRKWEQGDKQPSGPSLKLLNLLDRKGLDAML